MTIAFLELKQATDELREELDDAYHQVLASGNFILGPQVEAFEQEFAAYCGTRHCVTVGSGLEALHLILRASGIGPGDEVIVPAHTFIATWLAVSAVGATPVGVDVGKASGDSPAGVEAAPDASDGRDSPRPPLRPPRRHGRTEDHCRPASRLLLIEDAAQAHGASIAGRRRRRCRAVAGPSRGRNRGSWGRRGGHDE